MLTTDSNNGVKTRHRDWLVNWPKWKRVRDAVAGDLTHYLRNVGLNEADEVYGRKRQDEYAAGAICYNFTKRTLSGMVGSVMRKDPEQILPREIQYLVQNCDGSGVGLWQHAQDTLMEIDAVGRGGLLVDAPETAAATAAEQNAGLLNPVIAFYTAENIVNWRLTRTGSVNQVTMVVLREVWEYAESDNEFVTKCGEQYRVLDIDENGKYRQRLYRFKSEGGEAEPLVEIYPQLGASLEGKIPFTFIGASNNDASIDDAPMLPLAELNIGHFCNSADIEESSFVSSQPTVMIYPGEAMTLQHFQEANPKGIRIGARSGHNLGYGGRAELLQAKESNLALTLMTLKETQAVQIGAQLITPSTQITAESARIQRGADSSVMSTIARNVSSAYTDALKWVAAMMGLGDSREIEFKLNTEFFLQAMTSQDRAAWMADINAGLLPATAYYAALRKAGVTDWTDADIKEAIEAAPIQTSQQRTQVAGDIPATATDAGAADNQQNNETQQ